MRWSGSGGFTLAEVLIAALISAFVVTAALQLFIDQSETHLVQAGITDMQQNGRAAIDELSARIRQAGYMLPLSVEALQSWNSNPDTIAVAFLSEPACTASLSVAMAGTASELRCEDSDIGCFQSDSWAYIYDPINETGEYFFITGLDASSGRIYHTTPLSTPYAAKAQLYVIDYFKYYVDKSDTLHPLFMMQKDGGDPVVYADNIGDLQFEYVYPDGSVRDTISLSRYIRQVNLDVMVQTADKDLWAEEYRHDTLSTKVKIRNLGL